MVSWRRVLTTLIVAASLVGYGPVGVYAGAVGTGADLASSTSAGAIDAADATKSHGAVDPSRPLSDIPGVEDDDGNDTDGVLDGGNNATDDATDDADETTDDAEETADDTEETADDATDGTTENTEGTAGEPTGETAAETADDPTEATEKTGSVEEKARDATEAAGSSVDAETDGIEQGVTDAADDLEADVTDTTTAVTDPEDGSVGGIAGQAANTVAELDPVTAGRGVSVESSLDRVTVADQAVETTTSVDAFDPAGNTTGDGSTAAGSDTSTNEATVASTDTTDSPGESEATEGDETAREATEGDETAREATEGDEATDSDERDDDATDDGGVPLPDSGTGSGIAAGTVLIGAALIARSTGTAAVLSALGGSGGSLLGTLLSVLRDWVGRVLGIFGYKRYSDDDPLAHETRERLYAFIRDAPGSYLAEISDETGVTMGTARYHLRILEFENLVASDEIRGRRRYVPVGTDWAELEAALHDETTARILEALERGGPDSVSGLADRLDRDPSTISHHLDRLAEDGIVERERDGRAVVNKLADEARIALEDDATAPGRAPVSSGAD